MPIPIICPCSAKLRVSDHLRGLQIQCPSCLTVHDVAGPAGGNGHAPAPPHPPAAAPLPESTSLSAEEREKLQAELEAGERLLWTGKPDARIAFLMGWAVASGLFFLALVLGGIVGLTLARGMAGWVEVLFLGGIALAALGVGVVAPFLNRSRYARTVYAVTDRKVMAWDCDLLGRGRFKAYGPEDVASLALLQFGQRANAIGQLAFAREVTFKFGQTKFYRTHGFFYLRGASAVERVIRQHLIDPYTDRLMQ